MPVGDIDRYGELGPTPHLTHVHRCATCGESYRCAMEGCHGGGYEHYDCWSARTGLDAEDDIKF